jgi:hypothetical protein
VEHNGRRKGKNEVEKLEVKFWNKQNEKEDGVKRGERKERK